MKVNMIQNSIAPHWLSLCGQKQFKNFFKKKEFFKMSYFIASQRKIILIWCNMKLGKLWQNVQFWVNYPF